MAIPEEEAYDVPQQFYGCKPTLTDTQVLQFCQGGYLILKGVVPDDINRPT